MELMKSSYVFLLVCGVSNSLENSTKDSGNDVGLSRSVSQDKLTTFTDIGVYRDEDPVNPKSELRQKRNAVDKNCNPSGSSAFTKFASVVRATKDLSFVPPMKCNNADSRANFCKKAVRLMDCGAFYFKNATRPSSEVSLDAIEKLFHAYKEFADKSKPLVEFKDQQCCNVSDYITPVLKETLDPLLNNTEDYLENAKAKYCGWQISTGRNPEDATETVSRFGLGDRLSTIIEGAYHHHDGEQVHQILKFIENLPRIQKELAYKSFFEILQVSQYATSSAIIRFRESYDESNCSDSVTTTLKMDPVNRLVSWSFGKDVRSRGRNVPVVYNFLESHNIGYDQILPGIIIQAYNGNIRNTENILEFIKGLPKKEHQQKATVELFEEMKKTTGFNGHEILMVVNRMHKLQNDSGTPDSPIEYVTAGQVKEAVPNGIQALLREGKVSIQNKIFPNITIGLREKDDTYAMACPAGLYYDFSNTWSVEVLEDGRYFRFTDGHNRSLATSSRSSKVSASEGNSHWRQWQITPVHNGEYFYLANRATGQIMEAQHFEKRGIFKGCTYVNGVRPTRWQKAQKYWSIINVAETDTLAG